MESSPNRMVVARCEGTVSSCKHCSWRYRPYQCRGWHSWCRDWAASNTQVTGAFLPPAGLRTLVLYWLCPSCESQTQLTITVFEPNKTAESFGVRRQIMRWSWLESTLSCGAVKIDFDEPETFAGASVPWARRQIWVSGSNDQCRHRLSSTPWFSIYRAYSKDCSKRNIHFHIQQRYECRALWWAGWNDLIKPESISLVE